MTTAGAPRAGVWRQVLAMGATVGMAVPVSGAVIAALGPWLGYGWAFAACLLAAAVVGAGAGLLA